MSNGYNNVTVVGNLGKDPTIRSTSTGKRVASFSVAAGESGFGENKNTEWVNVICWEKLAELAEKYLKKGKSVALSGSLSTSSWEDKATGVRKYKTEVVARDLQFMDSGSKSEDRPTRQERTTPVRQQAVPETRASATEEDPFDIPF